MAVTMRGRRDEMAGLYTSTGMFPPPNKSMKITSPRLARSDYLVSLVMASLPWGGEEMSGHRKGDPEGMAKLMDRVQRYFRDLLHRSAFKRLS